MESAEESEVVSFLFSRFFLFFAPPISLFASFFLSLSHPQTSSPSSAKAQNVFFSSEKAQSMSLMRPERRRAVNC